MRIPSNHCPRTLGRYTTSVAFQVDNVNLSTTGSPDPSFASFSDAALSAGNALRISVKADAIDFTPPSGQVFQSQASPTSGSVDLTWPLAIQL